MSLEGLYLGDCLETLPQLADASIDAIITDPPYCSGARTAADVRGRGGMSRGALWNATAMPNDEMTTVGFVWLTRHIAIEAERLLVEGGSFLSFCDWRQYPNAYGAIETANLRIQMMVVWDKMDMALGNGFRNQHEIIIHAAKGVPNVYDRSVPNVIRAKRVSSSELHPTEKPVALMCKLIETVCPPDGVLLDPFMGSGTTGVACARLGRKFIGIERDPTYFAIAEKRIGEARSQLIMELA